MAIAAGICVAWPASVGSVPAGWVRETALDSRYIRCSATGANADLVTDRGSLSHSHTSPSHTPTQNSHTHEFSAAQNTANNSVTTGTVGATGADISHGHAAVTSNASTGVNTGIAITIDAFLNELSFVDVIWIKSDGTPTLLPAGCLVFFASDSLPSGWARIHGDRYLKGASSGGDGGATGGANTHTHTSPPHTHGQNAHNHTAATSAVGNVAAVGKGVGPDTVDSVGHTHSVSLDLTTPTNQSVTTVIDPANHEPPFSKVNTITSASPSLPASVIALWLGTHAGIPSDWTRYTALDDKWVKGCSANGEVGTTGGGSQHAHTAADCQPIQNTHSHTASGGTSVGTISAASGAANTFAFSHQHTSWSVTSDAATNNPASVTVDPCAVDAALPKHRTVIPVQFTGTTPPTPGRPITGMTTYDLGFLNILNPEVPKDPEIAQRVWRGDRRFGREE